MIERHLAGRGIDDPAILGAFSRVAREKLVPPENLREAYDDRPLDIGFGVTISQPYIVAKTIELARVRKGHRVLEIGTGSGYQTAILAEMRAHVYSIEVIPELSLRAQSDLKDLGYSGIHFHIGDGYKGWLEKEEFDAILLTAAPVKIPERLLEQLKVGGVLVGPEGRAYNQWLVRITRTPEGYHREEIMRVKFVPMVSGTKIPTLKVNS